MKVSSSLAAKLVQQRREHLDYLIVGNTIAGDQPVAILNIRNVVVQRITEKIGYAPARFRQDQFGRARVPLLCAWREMDVNVALLLDEQADLDSHRATLHFVFEAKACDDFVHAWAAM